MAKPSNLKIVTDDGAVYLVPLDPEGDTRQLVHSICVHGGVWVGPEKATFLPWHVIREVEAIE